MKRTSESHLAIYDGRDRLGALVQRGKAVDAFDPSGCHLGTFPSIKAAAAAIVGHHSRSVPCVRDQGERGRGSG